MQQSWHNDQDKLMFIILSKPSGPHQELLTGQMIGDVNLYLTKTDQDAQDAPYTRAEVEVMIPNTSFQRQGIASRALRLLFLYALKHLSNTPTYNLSPDSFFCKIGETNQRSQRLFEKLRFQVVGRSDVWKEVEMQSRSADCLSLWKDNLECQEVYIGPSA